MSTAVSFFSPRLRQLAPTPSFSVICIFPLLFRRRYHIHLLSTPTSQPCSHPHPSLCRWGHIRLPWFSCTTWESMSPTPKTLLRTGSTSITPRAAAWVSRRCRGTTPSPPTRGGMRTRGSGSGDCQLKHSGGPYGENLFVGWGRELSAADAGKAWVDERQHYNCRSNSCASRQVCGHYTQVVWSSSTRIGCARVKCSNGGIFITCNYSPPGTSSASALTHAVVCHRGNNSPPSIVNSAFPNPDHRTPPFGILDSALYREEKERRRAPVLLDIFWTRPRAPARPTSARCCRCYAARALLPATALALHICRSTPASSHRLLAAMLLAAPSRLLKHLCCPYPLARQRLLRLACEPPHRPSPTAADLSRRSPEFARCVRHLHNRLASAAAPVLLPSHGQRLGILHPQHCRLSAPPPSSTLHPSPVQA
ncbi:hypothetical protein Taro_017486 [Colocasia esculenta]|uniref:SCP domain-containing protein n=1 Tax=Colocasia esculenta TaxID=4460 RepID=A0A843UN85_COLES|nr:hypothetical protein [Colocasia esculenta]